MKPTTYIAIITTTIYYRGTEIDLCETLAISFL